ncbi:aminopeptidase [Caldibacillus debilis]|uniref:Aminopeptidase S (Leu, Val, Phe, Tyr preference) n=1 Tax=Caldibacillus debilis TaxID=301148 RepID=A0A150LDG0_9BACI|nr:aminopeptidase [Caldibacillus debilis]KYD10378.1 Aminopeptidase S (Leu, Val, Phe, Tyr preference) [Caldibacillus debilis]
MKDFQEKLEKYAELIVKVGVNVQPGQTVVMNAYLHDAPLARLIVKKAYELGAKHVYIDWADEEITRTKYRLAPDEAFDEYPHWRAKEKEELAEKGAAFISIVSADPDLLRGVDPGRISRANRAAGKALNKFYQYIQSDYVSWTVVASASQSWADKVFPDLPREEQIPALWEAIFKTCRIDHDDPVKAWQEHDRNLEKIVKYLNGKKYKKLHYLAPGTDLTIELPEKHVWVGAGSINHDGKPFMANMPTEEVFTAPKRDGVDGFVKSTKPLSYGGNLIEDFTITFENGRITRIEAKKGEEILKRLVETDEGARYLGEVALVSQDSPIAQSNILFYNTLFDENASSHLAIGSGYAFCVEGGKELKEEELKEHGINVSITHVDFMVGSDEMNIDGITADGRREPVMRNGRWAFSPEGNFSQAETGGENTTYKSPRRKQ